jgi:hypothetical protein
MQHFVFHSFVPASAGKSRLRMMWMSALLEVAVVMQLQGGLGDSTGSTITELICSEARDKARDLASLTSLHSR